MNWIEAHSLYCDIIKQLIALQPMTSVSELGDDYCRLSNKEIVITAVKLLITAHPLESKFEKFCLNALN
jgi:hypothetical protein